MKKTDVKALPIRSNPHNVSVRAAYDSEHAQIMHITLEPGQAMKWHVTPVDVVFYVLEGKVKIGIGEEEEEATAGTLVESPRGIKHMLANPFQERTSFLVMKLPRPAEKSKLL
ncbi:MAG: cupin domain-containing protein [Methanomassiliicoccales archaeon]